MDPDLASRFSEVLPVLDLSWGMAIDRKKAFQLSQKNAGILQKWLTDPNDPTRRLLRQILGFEEPVKQWTGMIGEQSYSGEIRPIEVHSVRVCRRTGPDGSPKSTLDIELTQTFRADLTRRAIAAAAPAVRPSSPPGSIMWSASGTLVVVRDPGKSAGGNESRGGRRAYLPSG
jgi:hypothetical protein